MDPAFWVTDRGQSWIKKDNDIFFSVCVCGNAFQLFKSEAVRKGVQFCAEHFYVLQE